MTRSAAAEMHFEHKHLPQSERRPLRPRVLVALHGSAAPLESIAMGRLVSVHHATTLARRIYLPVPTPPNDVPRILQVPLQALEGIVLDVEEGDPARRLVEISDHAPNGLFGRRCGSYRRGQIRRGVFATRAIEESNAPVLVVRPGALAKLQRILVPLDGTPSTAALSNPRASWPAQQEHRSTSCSSARRNTHRAGRAWGDGAAAIRRSTAPRMARIFGRIRRAFHEDARTLSVRCSDALFLGAGDPGEEILRYASTSARIWLCSCGMASPARGTEPFFSTFCVERPVRCSFCVA